jgi:hypothetical protein
MYAFVIGISQNEKKVNVFKVKHLEIYEDGVQYQRKELALKHTF